MSQRDKLLTIILVSYHSDNVIEKILQQIPKKYTILITDNALSKKLKKNIEDRFINTQFLMPKKNLGNGGGVNFALTKVKTKYALYLDLDIQIEKGCIDKLIRIGNKKVGWGIIAPNLRKYIYKKKYYLNSNFCRETSNMNFVEGCALMFNIIEMKKIGFYDEKIFLYFEENDLFFNCIKNKKKILLCNNIYIHHLGNASTDSKHKIEIELNRNWHYMWSKFYYYMKNYSYLRGVKETILQFIRSNIKLCFYYFTNYKKFLIYKNRASGLYNSYLKKNSWRRPNIK